MVTALLLLLGAAGRVPRVRRVPSVEVVMAHDAEPPPPRREGWALINKQEESWERSGRGRWRRALEQRDVSESKRSVPQGPNPLHN